MKYSTRQLNELVDTADQLYDVLPELKPERSATLKPNGLDSMNASSDENWVSDDIHYRYGRKGIMDVSAGFNGMRFCVD
ncbi:MAG: hypothetical protein ABIG37_01240 [Nanoarchaeota archaeon]|nr:hypothetical protein [Nanoarchaeota archaeon]